MKYSIYFLILSLSITFGRKDCFQIPIKNALGRSVRPEKDTFAISPTGHFYIHFDTTGNAAPSMIDLDENSIPDYIDQVGTIADSAHQVLINVMGWQEEPFDGDGGYDIYIMSYAPGVYGYNYPDIGSTSYLQIDNDYLGYNTKFDLTPLQIMQITVAHEYFHGIQWGYEENLGNNAYFYEMTSMWFEDILIPDGNDYIDGWTDPLFKNPELAFDNTGKGYELALFGHYLSSYIDEKGALDEKNSTIITEIWDYYSNYSSSNAFIAIRHILQTKYNYSFSQIWIDFLSRNLYNGIYEDMNNPFYYYIDQALADPILTSSELVNSDIVSNTLLSSKSAKIISLHTEKNSYLNLISSTNDYYIKLATISSSGDNILLDTLQSYIGLYGEPEADGLHLFFSKKDIETTLDISVDYYPSDSFPPWPPTDLFLTQSYHNINLEWDRSPGPGNNLFYNIFRENKGDTTQLITTDALSYLDVNSFAINEEYGYFITCENEFGESVPSIIEKIIYNAHVPDIPENFHVITYQDSVLLNWEHSKGPGDLLYYNIYRNNLFYDSIIDSIYIDYNIEPATDYSYSISSFNDEGESILTSSIEIESWPELESTYVNEFISVYPNPLSFKKYLTILFSLKEKDHPTIELINIKGQIIETINMLEHLQGNHREKINFVKIENLSSGIYFIHLSFKKSSSISKKIIILN